MFNFLLYLLREGREQIALTYDLVRDPRVEAWKKAIPFLPLVYIFSPINLFSIFIPFDDIYLVILAMELFERTVDPEIVAEYKRKLDD